MGALECSGAFLRGGSVVSPALLFPHVTLGLHFRAPTLARSQSSSAGPGVLCWNHCLTRARRVPRLGSHGQDINITATLIFVNYAPVFEL